MIINFVRQFIILAVNALSCLHFIVIDNDEVCSDCFKFKNLETWLMTLNSNLNFTLEGENIRTLSSLIVKIQFWRQSQKVRVNSYIDLSCFKKFQVNQILIFTLIFRYPTNLFENL